LVTKEQIERARQVDIVDYLLTYEADNIRLVGSGYRLKDHESLAVTNGKWYWHSKGFGGRTALDFLINVRGYGFVESVCLLLNEQSLKQSITPNAKPPPERIPFYLPLRNKDNNRVIAYLQSRGINRDLILNCIEQGSLYESTIHHNCVFTGKDENGKTRFAAMRATTSDFKRDADGSDKKYGFVLTPNNQNSREIAVFESAIDCLSNQTLCKEGFIPPFEGWRLSLGGTSDLALKYFLERHKTIEHCYICTDNDKAGNIIADKIKKLPGISAERLYPAGNKDWNAMLQSVKKAERNTNKTQQNETAYL